MRAILALSPTLVLTVAARFYPAVFDRLRRDPGALADGELWRLLSPVLVQGDIVRADGWWRAFAVLVLVAMILIVAERAIGTGKSLALYGVGALVGHAVGELWQPYGAGCSVAGCGVLGGLAAWLLRATPPGVKIGASVWLVFAVIATVLEDIHGPPLLAGALVGAWLLGSVPLPDRLRSSSAPR